MGFGPSNEDGHLIDSGEKTEKHEAAEGAIGEPDTAWVTGIGESLKDTGQLHLRLLFTIHQLL